LAAFLYSFVFFHEEEEKAVYNNTPIPMDEKENGDC